MTHGRVRWSYPLQEISTQLAVLEPRYWHYHFVVACTEQFIVAGSPTEPHYDFVFSDNDGCRRIDVVSEQRTVSACGTSAPMRLAHGIGPRLNCKKIIGLSFSGIVTIWS